MLPFFRLKDVKDVDGVAPNGMPLKARLQQLSEATGNDIVACANTCDTYTKKTLLGSLVYPSTLNVYD